MKNIGFRNMLRHILDDCYSTITNTSDIIIKQLINKRKINNDLFPLFRTDINFMIFIIQ